MVDRAASHVAGRRGETDPLFKERTGAGGMADLEYGGEQKIKADFIFRVYALLSTQLVITVAIGTGIAFSEPMKAVAISVFAGGGGFFVMLATVPLICAIHIYKDKYPTNIVLFLVFTVIMGFFVGLACLSVLQRGYKLGTSGLSTGAEDLLLSIGCTAVVFISLTFYAIYSGQDFSYLGGFLCVALIANIFFGIIASLFGLDSMRWLYCVIGVFIFSGYILYDTYMIVNRVQLDKIDMGAAITGALELYLDIINLFLLILELISSRDRR